MGLSEQVKKRALRIIFLIMLMDVVGMSIMFPVAPYIVQRYSNEALMVTMLTVIYAGAQFFAAPALGKISDRVGRRPVLLVSVFGSAIGLESTFNHNSQMKQENKDDNCNQGI